MLKGGGGRTSFRVAFTEYPDVLAILTGAAKNLHPSKGGGDAKSFTLS